MNHRYSMIIQWSDEDNCYLVHLPEFPWQQFHTHGKTYEEAAKHGQEVISSLIEWYHEQGKLLPEALTLPEKALKVA
ncbi:type II toxin-antitoxin system HicB family antitoxin [Scytonema hofmannii FACHB-248]|uniref:Type II toxin-antitoxin system HicB family antitoxin n=1 Tax=Scytonema hofmannii FACHB-248 TaxID=1842502 RepID=A0ABR8GV36_9CYAN|nr:MULTISPECIES: type II toxin-antitoxin system HicB family antitoxin [Nostocales]MBD2607017.1 type II toxin-antitoxin system HicB family antitoxin [Scytonema hofmannii FACHB-248]